MGGNYANVAWASTKNTNLKKLNSQQKQALRVIPNKGKFESSASIFQELRLLDIFKINIFKTKNKLNLTSFRPLHIAHYPLRFSENKLYLPNRNENQINTRIFLICSSISYSTSRK